MSRAKRLKTSHEVPELPATLEEELNMKVILNLEETTCSFCTTKLKMGMGILLQSCLHPFCRPCLVGLIEGSSTLLIRCPLSDCPMYLMEKEIQAIVKPEIFQFLERKSQLAAIPNAFFCKSAGCDGFCEPDNDSNVFHCPICQELNCIRCKAVHGSLTCDVYQNEVAKLVARGINDRSDIMKEIKKIMQQNSGIDQVISISGNDEGYDKVLTSLERTPLLSNTAEFNCKICFENISIGGGVILQTCYHMFCRDCLIGHIKSFQTPEYHCPEEGCVDNITPRELHALLPPDVQEEVTKRSWNHAESVIASTFHCLTPDCGGFCELEGDVITFKCPLCKKSNCVHCKAMHEGVSCEDFLNRKVQNENDQLSEKAVEELIASGNAMRCSTCKTAVQKAVGCDAVLCTVCRTELCWATKGPRWGPGGKGDISGGCRCRVNGRLCHPKCQNCH